MKFAVFCAATLACALIVAPTALASIQGNYSGNLEAGVDGGAAYSYVHASTHMPKSGDALYNQLASGQVHYAIDTSPGFNFFFNDIGDDGLNDGDSLEFNNATVGLRAHDGNFDGVHTGALVGTLQLTGTLTVGGTHSSSAPSSFTHGLRNITVADTDPGHTGLFFTIKSLADDLISSGEIFFQSGVLAGPFNGIKYDNTTDTLSFALWGNSLNKGGRETGRDASGGNLPLGFDFYVNAQPLPGSHTIPPVPEAASFAVWSLLAGFGLFVSSRRRIC